MGVMIAAHTISEVLPILLDINTATSHPSWGCKYYSVSLTYHPNP